MEVVARRGFDGTVDEIAELSGVSPRTIFRHYLTHDRLIAATVKDMYFGWFEDLPLPGDDLDGWIEELAVTVHTRTAYVVGAAFWDIHAPRANASEVLSEMDAQRRDVRVSGMQTLVKVVWKMAGGMGAPPEDLVLAFALYLSAFATQALMTDFDQTPAQIGALTAGILKMLLWRAIEAQPSSAGDCVDRRYQERVILGRADTLSRTLLDRT
jgi:AcrR family transcriptional regulator